MSALSSIPVLGSVLKRPATGYSVEKFNAPGLERSSVSAGCSRNLMESLNLRRPSLQRLHTPFRGTNRFARDQCCSSNGSESQVLDESILHDEFTAMQDRKLWETLLQFIEDISISIQNEDLEQLQKILHFDQGNFPKSPSRFFRSAVSTHSGVYLGSGFGSDQPIGNLFGELAGPTRPCGFRDILGEIFQCFETYFPSIRWNFKTQLEEEEAMQRLIALHGTKILAVQRVVVQDEQVREVQPAKLNTRQMLQMKIEAERTERAENVKLLQEGKIKGIQQTPLQMRCSSYRNKNDAHKKTAWQKIQMDWKANSVRMALRICDKIFQPSPKLIRAIQHHELRRQEELKKAEMMKLERPKTATGSSHHNKINVVSSFKTAADGIRKCAEVEIDRDAYLGTDVISNIEQ